MSFQHFRLHPVAPPPHIPHGVGNPLASSSLSDAFGQPPHSDLIPSTLQHHSHVQEEQKKAPYGSGDADDGYTLVFESMEAFQAWRLQEEAEKMVEFVKGDTHGSKAVPPRFKDHTKLVCARHTRSGRKKYVKKFPDRVRKVPSRKLEGVGCPASISYKTYFHTEQVRACYISEHSHEIGPANLPFTKRGRKAQAELESRNRTRVRSPVPPPPIPPTFQAAISMLAPLPPLPPPQPPLDLSQERWDRMGVLFGSVRQHARSFEYPAPLELPWD
ncbi:hypothetical protein A0H81_11682 [Grifola frondosa]|uniref:Uncharacterized protein n=1 Tax=Grifola frondosa TaxID=5627 RepID=A0A1C7LV93_GRIFR|nr:hypothetical protein A0H81_11682 [Grifola frondosa]